MADRILRRREVEHRTGLRRSSIYLAMQRGDFPKPLKITARASGWRESDIQRWLDSLTTDGGEAA